MREEVNKRSKEELKKKLGKIRRKESPVIDFEIIKERQTLARLFIRDVYIKGCSEGKRKNVKVVAVSDSKGQYTVQRNLGSIKESGSVVNC